MLIIPGVSMTGAFEDLLSGDTITGLLRLCEAMLVAVSIAVGFALATFVCGGYDLLNDGTPAPTPLIQLVTAVLAAGGYAMVCGFRKPLRILFGAIGGGLCQLSYILMALSGADEAVCLIVATVIGAIYAQILAKALKTPSTVFVLPAVIPLIPGRALYYTMSWALRGNFEKFSRWGIDTIIWALSIAFGLITVIVCASVIKSISKRIRKKSN